jgi:hypothetical protein
MWPTTWPSHRTTRSDLGGAVVGSGQRDHRRGPRRRERRPQSEGLLAARPRRAARAGQRRSRLDVTARRGVFTIAALMLQSGRITTMDILLDPAHLARLDLTAFDPYERPAELVQAFDGPAWLLVVGLAGHGFKDLWQHRRQQCGQHSLVAAVLPGRRPGDRAEPHRPRRDLPGQIWPGQAQYAAPERSWRV